MRRVGLPPGGSILSTSAPSPASVSPQYSACSSAISMTRMPVKDPGCAAGAGAPDGMASADFKGRSSVILANSDCWRWWRRSSADWSLTEHSFPRIDVNARAGDGTGTVRAKEGHGEGQLVGSRLSFDRMPFARALCTILRRHPGMGIVVPHRVHETRVHIIHCNTKLAEAGSE